MLLKLIEMLLCTAPHNFQTALEGGFCNLPGECNCRSGYSGFNCDINTNGDDCASSPCVRGTCIVRDRIYARHGHGCMLYLVYTHHAMLIIIYYGFCFYLRICRTTFNVIVLKASGEEPAKIQLVMIFYYYADLHNYINFL